MKRISDQQIENRSTEPSSPGRRTFVKTIGAVGAGAAAFSLLSNTVEAQAPAAPDNGMPSGSEQSQGCAASPPGLPGRQDRLARIRPLRLRNGHTDPGNHAFQGAGRRSVRQSRRVGERKAAVCCRCAQASGSWQPVVLARRLLESPAPG